MAVRENCHYLGSVYSNLFETPTKETAIVAGDKRFSYEELGGAVFDYSKIIRESIPCDSVNEKPVVAICLPKSPEFIFCVLACAFLGYIWVPIDQEAPARRINYQIDNCRADLIISEQGKFRTPSVRHLFIENVERREIQSVSDLQVSQTLSRDVAYYLYTSGSTGNPKCVALNHEATNHVFELTVREWDLSSLDVFIAVTPFHHDMSLFDIFVPLSLGATLVIPVLSETKNPQAWAELVEKNKVSIWVSVPAIVEMLYALANPEQLKSIRLIAQGGDTVSTKLVNKIRGFNSEMRLYSLGGPTETTIWSIWHEISRNDQEIIPYGTALSGNCYVILDENMNPCLVGQIGTMYVGGINLSNGYVSEGELSESEFVEVFLPCVSGDSSRVSKVMTKLYKTSDTGYFRQDGKLIFAGRKDDYIKFNGVRISAYEVELAIQEINEVARAIVVAVDNPMHDDVQELVAFYILKAGLKLKSDFLLRNQLKHILPDSHIPTRWMAMNFFPLTVNGKVDRKQLRNIARIRLSA